VAFAKWGPKNLKPRNGLEWTEVGQKEEEDQKDSK
jgi:hypothetical protein